MAEHAVIECRAGELFVTAMKGAQVFVNGMFHV
jgi:hypothetical protein